MEALKLARLRMGISQRALARLAALSYKSIQLIESKKHDPKISTLESIAKALGYSPKAISQQVESFFILPVDCVAAISERIAQEGEASWKTWLFNFVDAFRQAKDRAFIEAPPQATTPPKIKALIASTVEALAAEMRVDPPSWCQTVPSLEEPWFVAGLENLKAMALLESPVYFRKRNIFILENFLERR